ncbi:hypothetical protein ABENE_07005 [Asticcacaulis benevestitus DSM 16100 = ATCC BAA-896]|uniref:Uncharacterized protein n=1 Tax=Asticcacaulis benevestitus DSM 16100 = ATCC BAA-896 TaxID=1121022 RepID=V4PZI7_9CAUL|nr:hypothetical protein ABENE_07005 [Asticcacaulis benevestitus DSM 16100 = ATCC BAA-896]
MAVTFNGFGFNGGLGIWLGAWEVRCPFDGW